MSQNTNEEDKIVIEDESFRVAQETEISSSKNDESNEVDEDLLQIPAFLRRQAN